ncbi:dnajb6-a [Symbiodinium natans]|uniref:Dnajb6-a protein n=1 Tax=Symbiodinium natans TaxID=878477 RepID=A0A812SVS2_9DINO|nr:dnajb6-a [Symbiodinium natans]
MDGKPMDEFCAYVMLGLSEGCSAADVRRAYRRLALLCHPDKNPDQNSEESERRFRDIASAKDCLLEKLGKGPLSLGGILTAAQRRRARWCKPGPVRVERVVPVKPPQPPRVVVWACHVCEVAALGGYSPGARKDRLQPCIQPGAQTVCFCGHPLSDHRHAGTPSSDGWEKCQHNCGCVKFTYVQPYSRCSCGHGNLDHSPTGFFACQVAGCPCQTFHDPGTCRVCGHDWVCHRTELRHTVPPPRPRSPSRSSNSSSDTIFAQSCERRCKKHSEAVALLHEPNNSGAPEACFHQATWTPKTNWRVTVQIASQHRRKPGPEKFECQLRACHSPGQRHSSSRWRGVVQEGNPHAASWSATCACVWLRSSRCQPDHRQQPRRLPAFAAASAKPLYDSVIVS